MASTLDKLTKSHPELARAYVEASPLHCVEFILSERVHASHPLTFFDFQREAIVSMFSAGTGLLWLAPRGAGKSLIQSAASVLYLAIAAPRNMLPGSYVFHQAANEVGPSNIRILIAGTSAEKAKSLSEMVYSMMTSPRFREAFGDLRGERNTRNRFDTSLRNVALRECTVEALGMGSVLTGGHYDAIVCDDWVTEENARRADAIDSFFANTVSPMKMEHGKLWLSGTRYHPTDWWGRVHELAKQGLFAIYRVQALIDEGEDQYSSYCPERHPVEWLLQKRKEIGSAAFELQYQNEVRFVQSDWLPAACLSDAVDMRWLDFSADDRATARTILSIDPASGKGARHDFTGAVVLNLWPGKQLPSPAHVRHAIKGKWNTDELLTVVRHLVEVYRPQKVVVERLHNPGLLERIYKEFKRAVRVVAVDANMLPRGMKSKVERANYVKGILEYATTYEADHAGVADLKRQLRGFPESSNIPGQDDLVDALIWGLLDASRPGGRVYALADRRHI